MSINGMSIYPCPASPGLVTTFPSGALSAGTHINMIYDLTAGSAFTPPGNIEPVAVNDDTVDQLGVGGLSGHILLITY